jgi:hypothetical protein
MLALKNLQGYKVMPQLHLSTYQLNLTSRFYTFPEERHLYFKICKMERHMKWEGYQHCVLFVGYLLCDKQILYKDNLIYHFQQPSKRGTAIMSTSLWTKKQRHKGLGDLSKVSSKASDGAGVRTHICLSPKTRLMTVTPCSSGLEDDSTWIN